MAIPLIIYLILFVVPLVVVPGIALRFEPPKVLITEFLIELLAVYVIASGKFALKRVEKSFFIILLGLCLLSLFHLIADPSRQNLFGNVFRLQGTILFWHLLLLALITQNIYFRLKDKYIYTSALIAICVSAFLYGTNSAGRLIGSLGEPNALGAVVVLIFPFVFLSFKNTWVRLIAVIGAIGVINFSESKSALIAVCLQLLFIWLLKLSKGKYFLASIICITLLSFSLTLPILERQYFLKTNNDPFAYRFEDRAEIWQVAFIAGFDSPIFGSGLESIQGKINQTAKRINVNAQYQVIDSSHNLLLDYWLWGGFVGLTLLLSLIILTIKNLIQKKMVLETVLLLGLLTVLSFNPTTVSVLAGFWWVIGKSFAKLDPE